jgi:hypothetical protein
MRQTSLCGARLEARVFDPDLAVGDFGVGRPYAAAFDETARAHRRTCTGFARVCSCSRRVFAFCFGFSIKP